MSPSRIAFAKCGRIFVFAHFGDGRPVAVPRQPEAAGAETARAVEEQIAVAPDGRADVRAFLVAMRVAPQQIAVVRIEAEHALEQERDDLLLAVDLDEKRRRISVVIVAPCRTIAPVR